MDLRRLIAPKLLPQIFNNDPVRTVKLTTFIKEKLAKAQAVRGPKNFNDVCVKDGSNGVGSVGEVPWGLNTKRTSIVTGLLLIFDARSYYRGSG